MKERGIIFKAEMVRAILDGRKTQTRRVVKHTPAMSANMMDGEEGAWCNYGAPGDRLWVRETWADTRDECKRNPVSYRATWDAEDDFDRGFNWRPSIFMPRWASRITLEIVSVRVERLHDITEEDAVAEGASIFEWHGSPEFGNPGWVDKGKHREAFQSLWDSINAKRGFGWDSNPWVWRIEFRRVP